MREAVFLAVHRLAPFVRAGDLGFAEAADMIMRIAVKAGGDDGDDAVIQAMLTRVVEQPDAATRAAVAKAVTEQIRRRGTKMDILSAAFDANRGHLPTFEVERIAATLVAAAVANQRKAHG